jgi:hypothetical protein
MCSLCTLNRSYDYEIEDLYLEFNEKYVSFTSYVVSVSIERNVLGSEFKFSVFGISVKIRM